VLRVFLANDCLADRIADNVPQACVAHAPVLGQLPLDRNQVLGDDALIGCGGAERGDHGRMERVKAARVLARDRIAGRQKVGETLESEGGR